MELSDLPRLQQVLAEKQKSLTTVVQAFKLEDDGVVVEETTAQQFRKDLAEVNQLKQLVEHLATAKAIQDWGGQVDEQGIAVAANALQGGGVGTLQRPKTLGHMFTESPEFKDFLPTKGDRMDRPFVVEGVDLGSYWLGGTGQKDVFTTMVTGDPTAPRFGSVQFDPMVPLRQRATRVRDLFPARPTTAGLIEFIRVTGFTNNASVVPERVGSAFGLKPQSGLAFRQEQAPVRTIAHWEAAHRSVLADEPQLQATINNELLYGLRLHEDFQILRGTGTGDDLLGILNTNGIQTRARTDVANDTNLDAIRRALTLAELADYEATGVVLHPTNWETSELIKDTTNNYVISRVAVGAERRVWQTPVVTTSAMLVNVALVGAFGLGAQLYDRQQSQIRISESHSDWFVRNAIAILAEERLALAVKRPESFVRVNALN